MMEPKKIKVLAVEDTKADLRLLKEFLVEESVRGTIFEVTGADYLEKGLRLLAGVKFDIVLSDLFLPDSEGVETLLALCAAAPDTPVVVLTAFENEDAAIRAVHRGAQDYLIKKMITGEALARVIRYSIERKRIETELRAAETRNRALLDALDDLIVVLDWDCRVIMSNRAFKNAAREAAQSPDVTGRALPSELPVLPPKALKLCKQTFTTAQTLTAEEIYNRRGGQGVLELRTIPITAGGRVERAVIVAKDITERKHMEQIKDDFNGLVSHELRSPLTTVTAGLAIVLESEACKLGEVEKKLLVAAYEEAQRLNRILVKLLEMSRESAVRSRYEKAEADVVQLAEDTLARFAERAAGRGLELKGNYAAAKMTAFLDTDEILEVFTNLVNNALRFTEKGGIEIAVRDKAGMIECAVTDTGLGISKADQSQMFTKFRQFGKPVAGADKGTGLGLFIVKEIIRRHNGTISVSSEPGKGAAFTFTLPKKAPTEPATAASAQPKAAPPHKC